MRSTCVSGRIPRRRPDETRRRVPVPRAALAAALATLLLASPAAALQVMLGDPSCDGAGTCRIDNIDPVPDKNFKSDIFEIVLRDMQHIEIPFSEGGLSVTVFFGFSNPVGNPSVTIDSETFGFSDENGDPIGPSVPGFQNLLLGPGESFGNPVRLMDGPTDPFLFHDFEIAIDCAGCRDNQLTISDIGSIVFEGLPPGAKVGIWGVPEPSVLALLAAVAGSLVGVPRCRRRR